MRIEGGDDRFTVLAVFLGLRLVSADDVALALDLHLFGKQLRLAPLPLDQERHEWAFVGEHDLPHQRVATLAGAENVVELALFEPGDRLGRDHTPVGHDTDAANAEALPQPVDHRQQHGHVGRIARPHLGADGRARSVDHETEDHLLEIGPKVLRVAMLTQRLAALAVERQAGRIHEHGREIGEEVNAGDRTASPR